MHTHCDVPLICVLQLGKHAVSWPTRTESVAVQHQAVVSEFQRQNAASWAELRSWESWGLLSLLKPVNSVPLIVTLNYVYIAYLFDFFRHFRQFAARFMNNIICSQTASETHHLQCMLNRGMPLPLRLVAHSIIVFTVLLVCTCFIAVHLTNEYYLLTYLYFLVNPHVTCVK